MRRLALAVLALTLCAAAARAQDPGPAPAPSPSPKADPGPAPAVAAPDSGWTARLYTGGQSVITRGERKEYLTARATLAGPLGPGFAAFVRADVGGMQDGGTLASLDPSTFRSLVINAGVTKTVGLFDLGAVGGVSYSIEGSAGAPIDPRMYIGLGIVKVRLRDGGYVGGGGGWYGPVGGGAIVATASLPVGPPGAYTTVDFALPIQSNALLEKTWVLTIGATVRIKTFSLAGLAAGK